MKIINSAPYLPAGKLQTLFVHFKKSLAYRVWKRRLRQHGNMHKNSFFRILEVGCGPGYFLRCLEKWFSNASIFGGDFDTYSIRFTKEHVRRASLSRFDASRLPFKSGCLDVVVSLQVMEHLAIPECFVRECARVLSMSGLFLIATPNPMGISAKLLKDNWQGYNSDHVSLHIPDIWRALLEQEGFEILQDGTTGLSGLKIFHTFPLGFVNWGLLLLCGFFPWKLGESYMAIAIRK